MGKNGLAKMIPHTLRSILQEENKENEIKNLRNLKNSWEKI